MAASTEGGVAVEADGLLLGVAHGGSGEGAATPTGSRQNWVQRGGGGAYRPERALRGGLLEWQQTATTLPSNVY